LGSLNNAAVVVGKPNPAVDAVHVVKTTDHMVTVAAVEKVDAAGRLVRVLHSAEGADAPSGAMSGRQFCYSSLTSPCTATRSCRP
jgi:hypothetical protein